MKRTALANDDDDELMVKFAKTHKFEKPIFSLYGIWPRYQLGVFQDANKDIGGIVLSYLTLDDFKELEEKAFKRCNQIWTNAYIKYFVFSPFLMMTPIYPKAKNGEMTYDKSDGVLQCTFLLPNLDRLIASTTRFVTATEAAIYISHFFCFKQVLGRDVELMLQDSESNQSRVHFFLSAPSLSEILCFV
jgi:hypothetical protein